MPYSLNELNEKVQSSVPISVGGIAKRVISLIKLQILISVPPYQPLGYTGTTLLSVQVQEPYQYRF